MASTKSRERVARNFVQRYGTERFKRLLEALASGESNLALLSKVMRFVPAANLTGLPAISFPAGYDDDGLPVGFQAMGRAFEEPLLLRLAAAAEDGVLRRAPQWHRRLLAP